MLGRSRKLPLLRCRQLRRAAVELGLTCVELGKVFGISAGHACKKARKKVPLSRRETAQPFEDEIQSRIDRVRAEPKRRRGRPSKAQLRSALGAKVAVRPIRAGAAG